MGGEIEAHVEAEVGAIFAQAKAGGSVKLTTGYEWGKASTSTFTDSTQITMHDEVPKGRKLKINRYTLTYNQSMNF